MKVSSVQCALAKWKHCHSHLYCANHLSLGAFWHDTCISEHNNRKTKAKRRQEPDTSHHAGHPGQRTQWETNTAEGTRGKGIQTSVILFVYDVHNSRKLSGGATVNTFLFLDTQRQTEAAGNTAGCRWVVVEYFQCWGSLGCKLVFTN